MRVRTQAKRDAILEVASEVFCELGFERSSMAEIASRMGGSKATLYGYFESKDDLFVAVAQQMAEQQLAPAFEALDGSDDDLAATLCHFGEQLLQFACSSAALRVFRMVLAEAGSSNVGQLFYETGPNRGLQKIADYLNSQVQAGRLRPCDGRVAADHLNALLNAELLWPMLYGARLKATKPQLRAAVQRAVEVFLRAYAP
jgi:AcrR family transcriptional regulator